MDFFPSQVARCDPFRLSSFKSYEDGVGPFTIGPEVIFFRAYHKLTTEHEFSTNAVK